MTKRRSQFRRTTNTPISLTADDIAILRLLRQHQFRRTEDIHRHLPHRTLKKLRHRLRLLYDNAYIDRPPAQRGDHLGVSKVQLIYALGKQGSQVLSELDGIEISTPDWTSAKRPQIQHTLRIADVTDAVHRLPHHVPDVNIISADTILQNAPASTQRAPNPWQWPARVRSTDGSFQITDTIPDLVFGLDLINQRKRFYFYVEADCGTEPVKRSNRKQSSVVRKFEAYIAGFRAGIHRTRYSVGNIRILTCTTSPRRIQTMLGALSEIPGATDTSMFFFTDHKTLLAADHILDVPWIDQAGNPTVLIEHSPAQT